MLKTRRELAVLGVVFVAGCVVGDETEPVSVEGVLDLFFFQGHGLEPLRRAGEVVLQLPELVSEETTRLITAQRSVAEAVEALSARIQTDFEQRQLLIVDGWYLSRTEAHLCALSVGAGL